MDFHMNGDSYVFPVSGRRWAAVRDVGLEGGFLRYMHLDVWCPSDVTPALGQLYTHRNPAQPTDATPFLSNTFYINIDHASLLWGEPPGVVWTCEEWESALSEVLKHRPAGINVTSSWSHRTVPLYALFTALQQVIPCTHSLRGGIGVTYGQVSEEVLEEFCEWVHTVNLRVKLGNTTVLLSADRDEDYVTRLHDHVLAVIDSEHPPSYMTPSGQTVEYSREPLVDSSRDRVSRQTMIQLLEATGMKTDDLCLVNNLLQSAELTYNPSSEPSITQAEFDMD